MVGGSELAKSHSKHRLRLAEAQNWRCAYCSGRLHMDGTRRDGATVEHVTPRMLGGSNSKDNLVAACRACNISRSGFYSAKVFHRIRRWQLRKGYWPQCTQPRRRVRELLQRIFREAEAVRDAEFDIFMAQLASAPWDGQDFGQQAATSATQQSAEVIAFNALGGPYAAPPPHPLMNASRSALNSSWWVVARPCGAPG
ncbi:HNH endonuclease [Phenylobacterium sp. Root1277]|uniref:HNH endonuclease n=1 Tax=unclassified Phenylobacterium TaxID=2640670 RepID=UPI003514A7D1